MPMSRTRVLLASFLSIAVSLTLSAVPAQAGLKELNGPNAFETDANDINNNNVIVGFIIDNSGHTHGYVLTTKYTVVDVPGATATLLYGVNNHATAVGWYTDSSNVTHGLVVNAQQQVTTIDPPGSTFT